MFKVLRYSGLALLGLTAVAFSASLLRPENDSPAKKEDAKKTLRRLDSSITTTVTLNNEEKEIDFRFSSSVTDKHASYTAWVGAADSTEEAAARKVLDPILFDIPALTAALKAARGVKTTKHWKLSAGKDGKFVATGGGSSRTCEIDWGGIPLQERQVPVDLYAPNGKTRVATGTISIYLPKAPK